MLPGHSNLCHANGDIAWLKDFSAMLGTYTKCAFDEDQQMLTSSFLMMNGWCSIQTVASLHFRSALHKATITHSPPQRRLIV